jgi:hypothetical protein
MAHDRFVEAYYFLRQMDTNYHESALLRYNLNAFLAALKAVHELLQKELEQAGHVQWWKERKKEFRDDPVRSRFSKGRNIRPPSTVPCGG